MMGAFRGLATMPPAYFGMAMATGIVSIAARLLDMPWIALGLFWLNVLIYAALWLLTVARIVLHPAAVVADFVDHNRCVGFFTIVAATCVLGNQFVIVVQQMSIALSLWLLGILLWLLMTYSVFTILTVKQLKPTLAEGINGGWLLAVVAAQAVSALGGLLAAELGACREIVLFFTLVVWLGGGMLYTCIIALIFYRYTFFTLEPAHLTPPYWINMGAMAISTLAGTILIENAGDSQLLSQLLPFLKGLTLLFWSTATWWVPMLLILGVWRHLYRRFPLQYDAMYWGAVFPLGMYTVCTVRLSSALDFPSLMGVPRIFVYIALAAWLVVFTGFAAAMLSRHEPT